MRAPSPAPSVGRRARHALVDGLLHVDRWAEIDDLLLDGRLDEAELHLERSLAVEPVYLGIYGGEDRRFPYGGEAPFPPADV